MLLTLGIVLFLLIMILGVAKVRENPYLSPRYLESQFSYITSKLFSVFSFVKDIEEQQVPIEHFVNVPVLLYGNVQTEEADYAISADMFHDHMMTLKSRGYHTVTLDEFIKFRAGELELDERSFLLVFDKGDKDTFYTVDPIIRGLGFSAVMHANISTVFSEEDLIHLDSQDVSIISQSSNWSLGLNGYVVDYSELSEDDILQEVVEAKEGVESKYATKVNSYQLLPNKDDSTGQNPEMNKMVIDALKSEYDIVFDSYWPRSPDAYLGNFYNDESLNTKPNQVRVLLDWDAEEVHKVLSSMMTI